MVSWLAAGKACPRLLGESTATPDALTRRAPLFSSAAVTDVSHKRPQRVAQLLHKELSTLTASGLRDPRIGLVTITEVRLTDDLKNAQVFVSVLGDADLQKETLRGLTKAAGFLKREITHRLGLRFAPSLHFSYDDSLARAQRLDELLHAAARGEHEVPEPAPAVHMPKIGLDRMSPQAVPPPPTSGVKPTGRRSKTRPGKGTKSRSGSKKQTTRR